MKRIYKSLFVLLLLMTISSHALASTGTMKCDIVLDSPPEYGQSYIGNLQFCVYNPNISTFPRPIQGGAINVVFAREYDYLLIGFAGTINDYYDGNYHSRYINPAGAWYDLSYLSFPLSIELKLVIDSDLKTIQFYRNNYLLGTEYFTENFSILIPAGAGGIFPDKCYLGSLSTTKGYPYTSPYDINRDDFGWDNFSLQIDGTTLFSDSFKKKESAWLYEPNEIFTSSRIRNYAVHKGTMLDRSKWTKPFDPPDTQAGVVFYLPIEE